MTEGSANIIMIYLMSLFLISEIIKLIENLRGKEVFSPAYRIVLYFIRRSRGQAFRDAHLKKLMDAYDLKKEIRDSLITIVLILLLLIVPILNIING